MSVQSTFYYFFSSITIVFYHKHVYGGKYCKSHNALHFRKMNSVVPCNIFLLKKFDYKFQDIKTGMYEKKDSVRSYDV